MRPYVLAYANALESLDTRRWKLLPLRQIGVAALVLIGTKAVCRLDSVSHALALADHAHSPAERRHGD